MQHPTSETFDRNAREALQDVQLRGALRNLAATFGGRRKEAIATVDDWEGLRERARAAKDETLAHLDEYLEAFAENAERAGAQVHWARDGAEACRIVLGLIRGRGASRVVKSKSMATEEIHLNAALEAEGLAPVETDLGEWIIQLAHETPSHIVVPAIHKSKRQIAELFAEKVGIPPTDDVAVLTGAARRVLRQRFAEAEVGISGVNFGVAETGTILILENEGNVRLTTSLPRTHIALMGIEKVIPRLEELHIVLMDNGRSRMLSHPVTRQSLACIRCGACLNACPVYQQVGGHAYGSVYPGPNGAVITPQLMGIEKAAQLPYASSLCGACRDVCPVKIDIPQLLLHLRAEIAPSKGSVAERLAFKLWARVMTTPALYRMSSVAGRLLQRVVPISRAWTNGRDLRPIESKS